MSSLILCGAADGWAAPSWEWRNPQPVGDDLRCVWGTGGNHVFLVGAAGNILQYSQPYPDDLAGDFGILGTWYCEGSERLGGIMADPGGIEGWSGGLAVDFGALGLWNWDGLSWTPLNASDPEGLAGVDLN